MMALLDKTHLGEVSGLIAERMGLSFPEERWADLARGLTSAGEALGFEDPGELLRWLVSGEMTARQIETLASHLTVGETYFFRDPASFDVLEREILPPLVARRAEAGRTLRLWSAGCCTGEEAYSLAITCARVVPDIGAWNVSVLATDINPKFLAKAEAGVYSDWSFRGAPAWLRERYFSAARDKKVSIDRAVQKLVQFAYLNLAEDVYPALHNHTNGMDVIFCRNVLMYFTAAHQRRVVEALHRCLVDGGYLVVNPAEASTFLFSMFSVENIGGATLYRKTSEPIRAASWVAAMPSAAAAEAADPAPAVPVEPVRPVTPIAPAPAPAPIVAAPLDPLAQARKCADQGRLDEALGACRDAIARERTCLAAHWLYATICDELGRLDEAIAAFGKVLYLDQDFILAHHALGGLYRRLGKQEQSGRHLAIALELLSKRSRDEIVPESDTITCGRLAESVRTMTGA